MLEPKWVQLAFFQLNIAKPWRDRSAKASDTFACFYFAFAGVNALYFLWSKIDKLRGRAPDRPPNEADQLAHLLAKMSPLDAATVLADAQLATQFFSDRQPIERMDKRKASRPDEGDDHEGQKAREHLRKDDNTQRVEALGKILYLVRSNLVHGSKMDQGDDEDVVAASFRALSAILDWSIRFTASELETGAL